MENIHDSVDQLFKQILNNERSIDDLDEEETIDLRKKINPYGQAIKLDGNTGKIYAYSLINLQEEYQKKFLMSSLIGFLFRRADEWGVPDGDYVTYGEELNEEEVMRDFIEENLVDGKVVLKKEKKPGVSGGEEYSNEETIANRFRRMIVHKFLKDLFEFNPDEHVRSAYQRNKNDPERQKVSDHKTHSKNYKKNVKESKVVKKEREYSRIVDHIPPAELFHKFTYYIDSNHDPIRIATRNLYGEKPDLEYTLIIYNNFDSMDQYQDFVHKHESEFTAEIRSCSQNNWTIQTSCAANRERLQYYNRNNRVLQEIFDMVEAGQKLGKDMLNKRIEKKKKQNIEECGPDDEKFIKNYRREQRKTHKKAGLNEVSDRERAQADLEKKYISRYDKPAPELDEDCLL